MANSLNLPITSISRASAASAKLEPDHGATYSSTIPAPSDGRKAYERMLPFILPLAGGVVSPILLDSMSMVVAVLKTIPRIAAMRASIVALDGMDPRSVDDLEDCAHALVYANAQYQTTTRPAERLVEVNERAVQLRAELYPAVMLLVNRGDIDRRELEHYSGTKGYKVVATDLSLLAEVLRNEWSKFQNKSPVTPADVEEASRLGLEIAGMVAKREATPVQTAEAAQMRLLTYNLLLLRYQDVRAAVAFVRRRAGDADLIAPSIFVGRNKKTQDAEVDAEPADTAADASAPARPIDAVVANDVRVKQAAAPGFPGEDPFER